MFTSYNDRMMTNNIINNLIPNNNYQKCFERTVFDKPVFDKPVNKDKNNNKSFLKNEDALFWTFYYLNFKDDFIEYEKTFQREKDFKIKVVEKLRNNKNLLKQYKLKIIDIENNLVNEKNINVKTFIALCVLYEINIVYIWDFKFFELLINPNSEIFYIENNKDSNISILNNFEKEKLINNYFYVENIDKWLKCLSYYTKIDLQNICSKLKLNDFDKKTTKEHLYSMISRKINII